MYPDDLHIEPTRRTPWVVLDSTRIFIMGRSIVENPGQFYELVHRRVSEHVKKSGEKIKVEMGFDYINTGSVKWLYILLKELSETYDLSGKVSVVWYYEEGDEDMHELGRIIKSLLDCPFRMVQVEYMNDDLYSRLLSKSR